MRQRRGVAPIIGTILLVAITVVLASLLLIKPPLPPTPSQLGYYMQQATFPTWGDRTDCKTNATTQALYGCFSLPSFQIIITEITPTDIQISSLRFYFFCNGSTYLQASLSSMEWVPGIDQQAPAGAPQLGSCGSYTPPNAAFNRLAFFVQDIPSLTTLAVGDQIVLVAHSFEYPNCPNLKPGQKPTPQDPCDDDFHGAPSWCYTETAPNCALEIYYQPTTTSISSSLLRIPLYGLYVPNLQTF